MSSLRNKVTGITTKLSTMEENIDKKIHRLRVSMEKEVKSLKDSMKKEVCSEVEVPFHQDRSVVMYGLDKDDELDDEDLIEGLFSEILCIQVDIVQVARTKSRNTDQIGVVKVSLTSTEDKIEVLRNKHKCEESTKYTEVVIKSCEGHSERVPRINNKFQLLKLKDGDKYIITSHGLIKHKQDKKQDNPEDAKPEDGRIREANGWESGEAAAEEDAKSKVSDNTSTCVSTRGKGKQKKKVERAKALRNAI